MIVAMRNGHVWRIDPGQFVDRRDSCSRSLTNLRSSHSRLPRWAHLSQPHHREVRESSCASSFPFLDAARHSSPVTTQARSIACLPNRSGYLVGALAGDMRFRFPSHVSHTHFFCHQYPVEKTGRAIMDGWLPCQCDLLVLASRFCFWRCVPIFCDSGAYF